MKKSLIIIISLMSLPAWAVTDDFTQKVADLSVGRIVERNSLEYERAKIALSSVESLCEDKNAVKTADGSEAVSKYLREHGQPSNIIDVLESLATLKGITSQTCNDILVQYAQNRMSGATHTDALVRLNSLYKILEKTK